MGAITTAAAAAYVGAKVDKALEAALEEPVKRLSNHFCDVCKEKRVLSKINKELNSDDFLRDYIINSYNEIGRAKTLLYRDESQLIEKFCINTDLFYEDTQRHEKIIKTGRIQNILDHSHKTIITGLGGVGKTIMLKFMHINCIKQLDLIPVFITLRNIPVNDGKVSIFDSIKESLTRYGANMSDELIEASLQKGCYLILFDGFDEIKSEFSDTIAQEIQKFSNNYDNNYFVVSSRPSDSFISWANFKELHTKPLSKEQALAIIDKIKYNNEIKENFKKELDTNFYDNHESFASNSLLLTIMFLVYRCNGYIPDDFCDFYAKAFTVMFYEHDVSTKNHTREIHSKLSESELQRLFEHFCFKTFFKQQYSFKENELIAFIEASIKKTNANAEPLAVLKDLSENLCMLVKDGLEYKFVHRSFQEYFAAMYTKLLSDAEQKTLLSAFIEKQTDIIESSEYISILIKLDKKRFYKNIIVDLLDKIEETFNSVGSNDYKFLLILLKNHTYGVNKTKNIIDCVSTNFIFFELLVYLIKSYYNKHIDLVELLWDIEFRYSESIFEILNKRNDFQIEINCTELITELCEQEGKKDEIMEYFQPYLNQVKSWFQNRLYQESSIDDLLDDM